MGAADGKPQILEERMRRGPAAAPQTAGRLMGRAKNELKLMGSSLYIVSFVLVVFLVFLAVFAGELLNVSSLGFEVIFPFYTAVAAGEWGKTRSDDNYDVIAAQSRSVFRWLTLRYAVVVSVVSIFAVMGMVIISAIRGEMAFTELLLSYFPTAFVLSSISMIFGICSEKEHVGAMAGGVVWLAALMAQGLLRIPMVRYIYPFIYFAGLRGEIWLINKSVLCVAGLTIWCAVYGILRSSFSGDGR